MSDERLELAFRTLGGPAQPDPAFGAQLFQILTDAIDFEAGTLRRPSLRQRLRAGLRPQPWRSLLVLQLVVLALLAALVASLWFVGSRPRPSELVLRSKASYLTPPAFDMTVPIRDTMPHDTADQDTIDDLTIRYRYDGAGLVRGDILVSSESLRPPGSHFVFDGHTYYEFDAKGAFISANAATGRQTAEVLANGLFLDGDQAKTHRTWPLQVFPLTWDLPNSFRSPQLTYPCLGPSFLGRDVIAGRPTDHVACSGGLPEYWLDAATGLILKLKDAGRLFEGSNVEIGSPLDPGVFAFPRGPGGELPFTFGHVEPGSYFTPSFRPMLSLQVGEGWAGGFDRATDGGIAGNGFDLFFGRTDRLVDPGTGQAVPFSGSPEALIAWLQANPSLDVRAAPSVEVEGQSRAAVDVSVRAGAATVPCEGDPSSACVFILELPGVGHIQLATGGVDRYVLVDVDGTTIVIGIHADTAARRDAGAAAVGDAVSFP